MLSLTGSSSEDTQDEGSTSYLVDSWQYFYKPLSQGKVAVLLMNHESKVQNLSLSFSDVPSVQGELCAIRDVWDRKNLGRYVTNYTALDVKSHDSKFFVLECSMQEQRLQEF